MVGIDKVREYLGEYQSNYVIIGGTALNLNLIEADLKERSTKDIDMIMICEAMTPEYLSRFWDFIRAGGYEPGMIHTEGDGIKRTFYRFVNPKDLSFPKYIELFSRSLEELDMPVDMHAIHIPNSEDLSSFSALLMDDVYYSFATKHARDIQGVRSIDPIALVVLKAKAYVSNFNRKLSGDTVRQDDIDKHKRDVFRMSYLLDDKPFDEDIDNRITEDLREFIRIVSDNPVGTASVAKELGVRDVGMDGFLMRLKRVFGL